MKRTLLLCGFIVVLQLTTPAQWRYSERTDRMTDEKTRKFTLQGSGSRLELLCGDKDTLIHFYLAVGKLKTLPVPGYIGVSGAQVRFRVDQSEAQSALVPLIEPLQGGMLLKNPDDTFLRAKRLLVEYKEASGKERLATFNLSGLDAAFKKLDCAKR